MGPRQVENTAVAKSERESALPGPRREPVSTKVYGLDDKGNDLIIQLNIF